MAQTSITTYLSNRKEERLGSGLFDAISARQYNTLLCAVLLYGFVANAAMVYFLSEPIMLLAAKAQWWMLLVGYLVCSLAGIFIAARSTNPWVSFAGYNLVVLPIGMLLALLLPGLSAAVVTKALTLTAIVALTMTVLAIARPQVFLGLGRTLLIGLVVGLVAELVATFLLGYRGSLFDWLFVLIFSGYIGYDVAKAQAYPKTSDNAVDCALDIYLDIINLFIRLLSILSREN